MLSCLRRDMGGSSGHSEWRMVSRIMAMIQEVITLGGALWIRSETEVRFQPTSIASWRGNSCSLEGWALRRAPLSCPSFTWFWVKEKFFLTQWNLSSRNKREAPLKVGESTKPELWQNNLVPSQIVDHGPAALTSGAYRNQNIELQTYWVRICISTTSSGGLCVLYNLRSINLTYTFIQGPLLWDREKPNWLSYNLVHSSLHTKSKIHWPASSWPILIWYQYYHSYWYLILDRGALLLRVELSLHKFLCWNLSLKHLRMWPYSE